MIHCNRRIEMCEALYQLLTSSSAKMEEQNNIRVMTSSSFRTWTCILLFSRCLGFIVQLLFWWNILVLEIKFWIWRNLNLWSQTDVCQTIKRSPTGSRYLCTSISCLTQFVTVQYYPNSNCRLMCVNNKKLNDWEIVD